MNMDFEEFKNTLMDLVSKEVDDRGLEDISMKYYFDPMLARSPESAFVHSPLTSAFAA